MANATLKWAHFSVYTNCQQTAVVGKYCALTGEHMALHMLAAAETSTAVRTKYHTGGLWWSQTCSMTERKTGKTIHKCGVAVT